MGLTEDRQDSLVEYSLLYLSGFARRVTAREDTYAIICRVVIQPIWSIDTFQVYFF